MTAPVVIETVTLALRGDGSALENKQGVSTFDLTHVEIVGHGSVQWVPDPDNEESNTVFWVRGAGPIDGSLPAPDATVTLKLTYSAL